MSFADGSNNGWGWLKDLDTLDVILLRHAESFNNCIYEEIRAEFGSDVDEDTLLFEEAKRRDADCGLSKRGERQVDMLHKHLVSQPNAFAVAPTDLKVMTSPMRRCLLTSKAIADALRVPVEVHGNMYESTGCYKTLVDGSTVGIPGSTATEIETAFPGYKCMPGMESGWYKGTCKETDAEFDARAMDIVNHLWSLLCKGSSRGFKGVVIVVHGNVISAIINGLLTNQSRSGLFIHHNTGFSRLQLVYDRTSNRRLAAVQTVNSVVHLESDPALKSGSHMIDDHWIQEFVAI